MNPEVKPQISLIIPTKNRPEKVDRLLGSLEHFAYLQRHDVQTVVIDSSDNSATRNVTHTYASGYIEAQGLGKSSAMNLGVRKLDTPYIAFIDDDVVIINSTWLDTLYNNFSNDNVAYVSGRVIAYNPHNETADRWEKKGALNKGPVRIEVSGKFFKKFRLHGVPVQLVTMGANHLMRRDILTEIGMHDERFGPGQPIGGAGADLDLTYKVLRSGYTVIYDPTATVAHEHPETIDELQSKLFIYGISDTAIHMKFLMEFHDMRSAFQLAFRPLQNVGRLAKSLIGKNPLPTNVHWASIRGNLIGPYMFLKHRYLPSPVDVAKSKSS